MTLKGYQHNAHNAAIEMGEQSKGFLKILWCLILSRGWQNGLCERINPNFDLWPKVICLCNSVFDEDLREYLDAHPIN